MLGGDKFPKVLAEKAMSFEDALKLFANNRDKKNPSILLGVKRNGNIILNPKKGQFDRFKDGDSLIVMAFESPDLSGLK